MHPDQAKARKAIAAPLNEDAVDALRERSGMDAVYVFTYRGKVVKACKTRAWKNALHRAGIENFRRQDQRHTWASWYVQNGTSLQELGGWSSYEMVLRYAHQASDHLRESAQRIVATNPAHA